MQLTADMHEGDRRYRPIALTPWRPNWKSDVGHFSWVSCGRLSKVKMMFWPNGDLQKQLTQQH